MKKRYSVSLTNTVDSKEVKQLIGTHRRKTSLGVALIGASVASQDAGTVLKIIEHSDGKTETVFESTCSHPNRELTVRPFLDTISIRDRIEVIVVEKHHGGPVPDWDYPCAECDTLIDTLVAAVSK